MSTHAKAAAKFLADRERAAWHDRALFHVREKRDRMAHAVPEWEALRQAASEIKLHTLSHLGRYLEEFERNATANGMVVHWASDAREMNRIVLDILRRHGGRTLIKSKSMLSEECGLAPFLAGQGIDAVESDLGERIMQLMHRPPSHIVLPAIHVRREEVGELFERELGTARGDSDPTYLTHEARKHLRGKFLTADVAMTGVNFAVASEGAFAVCTNEGNADLGTSFPDLHIAIMGLEKVVPDYRSLAVFTRLLARSATGQPVTAYRTGIHAGAAAQTFEHVAVRRLQKYLSCLPAVGRLLLLVFHPRPAGNQLGDAALARTLCGQRVGLFAVLLLLERLSGADRPGRTDLRVAAGDGCRRRGRYPQETGGRGNGRGDAAQNLVLHGFEADSVGAALRL